MANVVVEPGVRVQWRRAAGIAMAIAVVWAASWTWGWVREGMNYDGLGSGGSYDFSGASARVDRNHAVPDVVEYRYSPGDSFRYGFVLYNHGDRAAKVKAFDDFPTTFLFKSVTVSLGPPDFPYFARADRLTPFEPFTLRPGQGRWVELRFQLTDCPGTSPGPWQTFDEIPMKIEVGTFDQSTAFKLSMPIAVLDTPGYCPPPRDPSLSIP